VNSSQRQSAKLIAADEGEETMTKGIIASGTAAEGLRKRKAARKKVQKILSKYPLLSGRKVGGALIKLSLGTGIPAPEMKKLVRGTICERVAELYGG